MKESTKEKNNINSGNIKLKGLMRTIDNKNRVVLPLEIINEFEKINKVEIFMASIGDENVIVLKPLKQ